MQQGRGDGARERVAAEAKPDGVGDSGFMVYGLGLRIEESCLHRDQDWSEINYTVRDLVFRFQARSLLPAVTKHVGYAV